MRNLVLASVLAFAAPLATAQGVYANTAQRTQAEQLVEAGLAAARKKDYREAVNQFEAAYKLYPHVEIRHNLARAYEELGELKKAYMHFEGALEQDYRYASEARERLRNIEQELRKSHARVTIRLNPTRATIDLKGADGSATTHVVTPFQVWLPAGENQISATNPEFRPLSEKFFISAGETRELSFTMTPVAQQGFLQLTTNIPNAEASLSGRVVATSPFPGSLEVDVGAYALEVKASGFKPFSSSIVIQSGQVTQVHALLEKDANVAGKAKRHNVLGWSFLGAGILAGGTAAYLQFGEALPWDRKAAKEKTAETRNPLVDKAESFQTAAIATGIGAAVLAGVGVFFLATKPKVQSETWTKVSTTFTPSIGLSPEGAFLGGTLSF